MLEGLSAGKQVDGLSGLLSRPFYLVFEISTALVPGLLFLLLVLLKRNATVLSIAQTATLGYKTKLVVGLFVSYFLGKIFAVPFPHIIDALVYPSDAGKSEAKQFLYAFLGGAVALPALLGELKGIDYVYGSDI